MKDLETGRPSVLEGVNAYLNGDFSEIVSTESELYDTLQGRDRPTQLLAVEDRLTGGNTDYSEVTYSRYVDRGEDLGPDKLIIGIGGDPGRPSSPTEAIFTADEFDRNQVVIKDRQDLTWKELLQNFNSLRPTVRVDYYQNSNEFEIGPDETPQEVEDRIDDSVTGNFDIGYVPKHDIPRDEPGFVADYEGGRFEYHNTGAEVIVTNYTEQFEGVVETLTELDPANPYVSTTSPKLTPSPN